MSKKKELFGYSKLLGHEVEDCVTKFREVVTSVSIDLYGCIQAVVSPRAFTEESGEQKVPDSRWCDVSRLRKLGSRVMDPIPPRDDSSPEAVAAAPAGGDAKPLPAR